MRVLQLSKYYPPTLGGVELVADFLSRAACDAGHEVTVVAMGQRTESYRGTHGETVWACHQDLKLSSSPFSREYYLRTRELLRRNPPDVILLHLPHPFAHEVAKALRAEARAAGCRLVGIYHSDIVNQRLLRDLYNLHFMRDLALYDAFVCSSTQLRDSSPVLSRVPSSRVFAIPFCVQPPPVAPSGGKRRGYIAVGRMVPYKGYDFLLDCFQGSPRRLTMVGDGPLRRELEARAGANVHFTGPVSERRKYELFAEHEALVMSSVNRAEAYGMTIVEAFSVGLPVIAANIDTGVSFLVREGQTGLKFPVRDDRSFHQQLSRLEQEAGLWAQLSAGATQMYRDELSYPSFAGRVQAFLQSLA